MCWNAARFTKFRVITQSKDHYDVQDHSRSPILRPIESYEFLLMINTNLPPILNRFQVMVGYCQIFASERGVAVPLTLSLG